MESAEKIELIGELEEQITQLINDKENEKNNQKKGKINKRIEELQLKKQAIEEIEVTEPKKVSGENGKKNTEAIQKNKAERFNELFTSRVNNIINKQNSLGKLANTNNYVINKEYKKAFQMMRKKMDFIEAKFDEAIAKKSETGKSEEFSF